MRKNIKMKFRIKKEDGIYFAEFRERFFWHYVSGSVSRDIEETKEACKRFKSKWFEETRVVESFEL